MLWEKDQLNKAKACEAVLQGFQEGPLNFPPTYKFDVGTHTYDTSTKKRKPAWTDRVLWRLRAAGSPGPAQPPTVRRGLTSWLSPGLRVTQRSYRSHMGYTCSDHKPISAVFSLQFPFKMDVPLVTLSVDKEWTKVSDASVSFQVASSLSRSTWDWIALYKVGFRHPKDYASYIWTRQEDSDHQSHEHKVTFSEEDLPKGSGEYMLGYYSHNLNSIVGLTQPFQMQLPSQSPALSRKGSSASSTEDDSTLELLPPQSRSPSPAAAKTRQSSRSRSPALPTLQGLGLRPRPHSRDTGPRSPSPRATTAWKERLLSPDSPTAPPPGCSRSGPPGTPVIEVSTPEALIAAIIPPSGLLGGAKVAGEGGNVSQ
nr:phosphatidylinositol 4,5-bisphosphate 5-phosphatase A-like [Paramormyrops kingsleyae]